jgi:hypothetical protein
VCFQISQIQGIISTQHYIGPPKPLFVITNNLHESCADMFGAFVLTDSQFYFVPRICAADRKVQAMSRRVNDQQTHG